MLVGLSWARGLGGAGRDLVLDLVPGAPPSPEPGSANLLHYAEGCLLEKALCCRQCTGLGRVWEDLRRHALSSGAEASRQGGTQPPGA